MIELAVDITNHKEGVDVLELCLRPYGLEVDQGVVPVIGLGPAAKVQGDRLPVLDSEPHLMLMSPGRFKTPELCTFLADDQETGVLLRGQPVNCHHVILFLDPKAELAAITKTFSYAPG